MAERSIGRTLNKLFRDGNAERDELFICTKNGYLTHDGELNRDFQSYIQESLIDTEIISSSDISSQMHCMTPRYLKDQFEKSLTNLGLNAIDLIYLHNPAESQIRDIGKEKFLQRLEDAFRLYEDLRSDGKILYYGLASWNCFLDSQESQTYLGIEEVVDIAKRVAGLNNHFCFIQLPFNVLMNNAYCSKNQEVENELMTPLEACRRLQIGVFTSVPLMQGQVLHQDIQGMNKLGTPAQRNIQLIRSTPGVLSTLIGQKSSMHVKENLETARSPLMKSEEFSKIKWEN